MDHNGFYADLENLNSLTSSIGTGSFSDTNNCSTLPSLNNFKYQQSTSNIYQQQTIPDLNQSQHTTKSTSVTSLSSLPPQTQININNCNNNIFFPHDDNLFVDSSQSSIPPNGSNSGQRGNSGFVSHHRGGKETTIPNVNSVSVLGGTSNGNGMNGGSGDSNITYNINNINTNIVNNINNPTNLVNNTDIFGSNQYHQINKSGETIINFTNNNLNATAASSMPTDIAAATSSQNFYGYQANNGSSVGQIYEAQASNSSSTLLLDMSGVSKNSQQKNPPQSGLYPHHHHHQHQHSSHQSNQAINNGSSAYLQSGDVTNGADYTGSLTATKVINNFESKNPIKYASTSGRPTAGSSAGYYPPPSQYASHPSAHGTNYAMYPPSANGMKSSHAYELHPLPPHPSRMAQRNYLPGNPPYYTMEDSIQNRTYYPPRSAPYHHPHHTIPHPQYGNYYNNNYNHPPQVIPAYSSYPPQMHQPYANAPAPLRNDSCSKSTPNYSKTGAMAMSPVDHSTFPLPPAHSYTKNFSENPYYYELSSCAKKAKGDIYNVQSFNDHHHHPSMPPGAPSTIHHQQNGNVMRNASYQASMPKSHYSSNGNVYSMPPDGLNSCDFQSYNYRYKNGDLSANAKAPQMMSSKQFKTFNHFEPPHPPTHHPYTGAPQYHTMQVKQHPGDKMKMSIDLEEQINSSKIPKMREPTPYGYDIHYPTYYPYHHRATRNSNIASSESDKIANINISLRDFLSTWNEIDEDDESKPQQNGMIIEDLNEHIERTIMREYNPMFVQKATDNIISGIASEGEKAQMEASTNADGTEKLYVLETIDVPISELNKYKHLSIINKLPENVVITGDKELFTDIEMNREKLYKSEFELEFEACEERKIIKVEENIPTVEVKSSESEAEEEEAKLKKVDVKTEEKIDASSLLPPSSPSSSDKKKKAQKLKKLEKLKKPEKAPKLKQSMLKLKKEKILKVSKDPRKTTRIAKRIRKYSLNQRTSSVKCLQSICVDFLNTSQYRNHAREQISINKKFSKMKILNDFKKKFNFDGMKKQQPSINQKLNHSRGRLASSGIFKVHTLKEICTALLTSLNVSVVDLFSPSPLKELCESFIYSNRQFFHIEEVSAVPKLQDLCKDTLSANNVYINIDDTSSVYALNETASSADEPIYIVEENSGNVGELFESDALNPHEKSELMRKLQRATASMDMNDDEADDEIIRAIGALHDDEDDDNNNSDDVFNKNIIDDYEELFESVQYEEIIAINSSGSSRGEKMKKIVEILRHKYLNRPNVRQACRTIHRIMHKSLDYQRARRFHNARRKERINELLQQARNAMCKLRKNSIGSDCDNKKGEMEACNDDNAYDEEDDNDDEEEEVKEDDSLLVVVKSVIESHCVHTIDEEIISEEIENFLKMPIVFPSINEYKIEQQQMSNNHRHNNYNHHSNNNSCNNNNSKGDRSLSIESRKRKMSFDESLLNINKMYRKRTENIANETEQRRVVEDRRHENHRVTSRHSRNDENDSSRRRRSRSRHRSSRRSSSDRDRENGSSSRRNFHHTINSSRHDHHIRRDQNNSHSETRRLFIPSYKLYDKDLDVKLKVRPYVRIEREEHVDDLVKKYN